MSLRFQSMPLILLRWTLGLVVLWESVHFAVDPASAHHVARMGLPRWTAPLLGSAEVLAAVLFLIPKMMRIGSFLLLFIFLFAVALHILHREYEIGSLLVYSAAVLACMSASGRN